MKRQLLVTSALPYANGSIHIGHLVEHIQTDIWVRFQKLRGHHVRYFCADDAHGTAIMLKAEEEQLSPEAYIAAIQAEHIQDFKRFDIEYDCYYSTHSDENREFSETVYLKAQKKGIIKKKTIKQLYDPVKELFLADRYIKGECPKCGAPDQYGDACEKCFSTYSPMDLINPVSTISGATPVIKESEHHFFDLSIMQPNIEKWLAAQPVTQEVYNKCKEWLDDGLKDWDISRDAPYFGFLIPNTSDKYFYVWLDAPIGYMATTKKWCNDNQIEFESIWNDDTEVHHFIGKDIMYFHTLFWPAMLETGGFTLPTKVNVHGFLTVNGEKMSKSRGTFILAKTFADHIDPIFLRYYLASKLNASIADLDFNPQDFVNKVNADIINKFSNILSRTSAILSKNFDNQLGEMGNEDSILQPLRDAAEPIAHYFEHLETHKALMEVMKHADSINTYINDKAPWSLVKTDRDHAQKVCAVAINGFRILCIWLKPIIPDLIKKFEHTLNIPPLKWGDEHQPLTQHSLNEYAHHYQRLKLADIESLIPIK